MGNGISFEKKTAEELNGKKYSEIKNPVWRKLLREAFPDIQEKDEIVAKKLTNNHKADILLTLKRTTETIGLSLKSGGGNSIHQEPLESFIQFCRNELKASKEICSFIELFIKARKKAYQLYRENPEWFDRLNRFFHENRIPLLRRFLVTGTSNKYFADFIVHKNNNSIVFAKTEDILKECQKENSFLFRRRRNTIKIGPLTFQAWNRNTSGNPNRPSERKRGHIQIKWGSIGKDLQKLNQVLGKK